jgi:lysine 2,3-aminomutase
VRRAEDLDALPIDPGQRSPQAERRYNVRIPRHYLELIDWDDPRDPVRLQSIPAGEELEWDPRELADPIGDHAHGAVPRLTHRYPDRVLLHPTYQCAIYCRHCFRKEALDDAADQYTENQLQPAFEYITAHEEIREVILTGGDPLVLSNARLAELRGRLELIPHLRMLRVHTRLPVVHPARITDELVDALRGRLMVCVVTHFNHPNEIAGDAVRAAALLRGAGFLLLNQTVLLKGLNDDVETLRTLFQELVYTLGIKPYYLHHCDLARGLTHMRTTIDRGLELMRGLRGHLSGICLPEYVLDLPGGYGKIPLGPSYTRGRDGHDWTFESYRGQVCRYCEVVTENPILPHEGT